MTKRRYPPTFIATLLALAARGDRPLGELLREHGVPERTFHHWRRHFPGDGEGSVRLVRELRREVASLRRRNEQLERSLALQREVLGKPWRRLPPGARPSGG